MQFIHLMQDVYDSVVGDYSIDEQINLVKKYQMLLCK
jgi:hypothetical protein